MVNLAILNIQDSTQLPKNLQLIQQNMQRAIQGVQGYTPKTSSNWKDPQPTNIIDAIDRIATLLQTLNGGNPIP